MPHALQAHPKKHEARDQAGSSSQAELDLELRLGLPETDSHASSSRQQRKLEIKEKVLLNEAS